MEGASAWSVVWGGPHPQPHSPSTSCPLSRSLARRAETDFEPPFHLSRSRLQVALVVIAEAGFGIRLPWSDHQKNLGSQAPRGKIALGFKKGAHLAALDHRPSTPDIERQTFALDDESFDDSCATEDRHSMLQTNADDDKASKGGFWAYVKGLVGKSLSVQEALRIVALNTLPRMILPKWAFWFPLPYMWEVDRGYVALEKYMKNLVVTRRQRILDGTDFEEVKDFDCDAGRRKGSEVKRDLFGSLVRSALECGEKDGAGQTLSDEEVVGYVFSFANYVRSLAAELTLDQRSFSTATSLSSCSLDTRRRRKLLLRLLHLARGLH